MKTRRARIDRKMESELSMPGQRTLTYFVRESITVQLTSCVTGWDLAKRENVLCIKDKQSSWILTSQTGGQPYRDTSLSEVSVLWPG